jgi:hypothetical protein
VADGAGLLRSVGYASSPVRASPPLLRSAGVVVAIPLSVKSDVREDLHELVDIVRRVYSSFSQLRINAFLLGTKLVQMLNECPSTLGGRAQPERIPCDYAFLVPLSFAKLRPLLWRNVTVVPASTHSGPSSNRSCCS